MPNEVELFHWNPSRPVLPGRLGRKVPFRRSVNNFGDLLGPVVVRELLRRRGLHPAGAATTRRLLSIGSVLRVARDGDVVWGSGVNGKSLDAAFAFTPALDVRAVRGPLTRDFLLGRGVHVPPTYGDPGLLVGEFWSRESLAGSRRHEVTVIPNLNDLARFDRSDAVVDPRTPLWDVVSRIASSDFVTGSSLHAVVLADSFGIPARLMRSSAEPDFKYDDYYRGSGRDGFHAAATLAQAMSLGGEAPPQWDSRPLLAAFPDDLWLPDDSMRSH